MEQLKSNHNEQSHQHDHARRDDLQWTQYITSLAANKLAPPKSQTLKVLEQQLALLNEEILAGDSRVRNRVGESPVGSPLEQKNNAVGAESERGQSSAASGLAVSLNDVLPVNNDNGPLSSASLLGLTTATSIESSRFSENKSGAPAATALRQLQSELHQGGRWIEVLWQFISAHQKRVLDLERLGVEPSERIDIQVDMIRHIAASYEKLGLLTRLPDSLSEARECKMVDDIRTMALVYVARRMMDVASPSEIADAEDNQNQKKKQKQKLMSQYLQELQEKKTKAKKKQEQEIKIMDNFN
jgi:hypothetical protein